MWWCKVWEEGGGRVHFARGHRGIVGSARKWGSTESCAAAKFRQFRWSSRSTWGGAAAGRWWRENTNFLLVYAFTLLGAILVLVLVEWWKHFFILCHHFGKLAQLQRWQGKGRSNLLLSKCQLVEVLGPERIATCPYPGFQAPKIGLQVGGQQS